MVKVMILRNVQGIRVFDPPRGYGSDGDRLHAAIRHRGSSVHRRRFAAWSSVLLMTSLVVYEVVCRSKRHVIARLVSEGDHLLVETPQQRTGVGDPTMHVWRWHTFRPWTADAVIVTCDCREPFLIGDKEIEDWRMQGGDRKAL